MATEISNKLKDDHNKEYILKQLHDFYKYVKPYSGPAMIWQIDFRMKRKGNYLFQNLLVWIK